MPKIVYAPILEQAGFLKRKAADVVEQWVAQLDGATQYWQLSEPIEVIAGDEIFHQFKKSGPSNNTRQTLTGLTNDFTALVLLNNDGTYLPSRGDFFVDDELVTSSDNYPTDALFHDTKLVSNTNFSLELLGANWAIRDEEDVRNFSGVISLFKVVRNGVVIHEIPLTNKSQGATQLPTVGNVSATMSGYEESTWKVKVSYDLVMSAGQSKSIGTMNGNFNPKPPQPELDDRYKVFNGTGSVGLERAVITDELTSSFVQYEEGSTHAPSFYTHGTSFLKSAFSNTDNLLWVNAGIGGEKIENLDFGGNTEAYNNQIKYIERAKLIDDVRVKVITFFQGSSNTGDRQQDYYDKMVTYESNQQTLIKSAIPNHQDVPFVFYQNGGGRNGLTIQQAQLDFMKNRPESKCVGGTYWLNRQHPNTETGVDGASSSDRVHLSVDGYRYLGDMAAIAYKTDAYKPMYVETVSLDSPKTVRLSVHVPFSGNLVFDTSGYNTPQFSGYGIELQNADGTLVVPTDVQIHGNDLLVTFTDDVLYGSRLRIGYTPDDIGADFDTPTGDYPSTLTGTNIRSDYAHKSSVGLSDFYDWLCCDVIYLYQETQGMPAHNLGSECWRNNASTGINGYGQNFRWDGVNLTKYIDGQDVQSQTSTFVLGTSNPEVNFGIRQGKTYRVSCDVNITTSDFIRIYVGGFARVNITSADNGAFSADIVAAGDYKIEMRVESSGIIGTLDNISIREVLE